VLDVREAPLAGIPIGVLDYRRGEIDSSGCESADDGRFELPLSAADGDSPPVALATGRATLASEQSDGEWQIVLTDTAAYSGSVVDEAGAPVAGAELTIEPRRSYFREHGSFRPLDPNQQGWKTSSDSDGRFALAAAPAGDAVEILARAAGYPPRWTQVPAGTEGDVLIVLRRSEGVVLSGLVLGPAGEPVAGAHVSTGREATTSGADGAFTVLWRPSAVSTSESPDGSIVRRTETHIHAVHEDFGPVQLPLADLDVREPIVLRLRSPLAIRGRVVDTRGEPLAGVVVWPRDPTPLGDTTGGPAAGDPFNFACNVENVLRGGEGAAGRLRTGPSSSTSSSSAPTTCWPSIRERPPTRVPNASRQVRAASSS